VLINDYKTSSAHHACVKVKRTACISYNLQDCIDHVAAAVSLSMSTAIGDNIVPLISAPNLLHCLSFHWI